MLEELTKEHEIGVLGAGMMGSGIAQVAATYGHNVTIYDVNSDAIQKSESNLNSILNRQVEKGRMTRGEVNGIINQIHYTDTLSDLKNSGLVIEAIIEDLEIKKETLSKLEELVNDECIFATNTSSLSIAAISSVLHNPEHFLGTHFFNPAPLMPLVEIIPGVATKNQTVEVIKNLMLEWGKIPVLAKDTPGFIVNRVARPFYGEALRQLEEGVADVATIDWAMKKIGGFRMGPFELMDFIGNDVNYKVTETVFKAFYFDPRFKPSFAQKRLVEAGYLGRKSGRGFYDYRENAKNPEPVKDEKLGKKIVSRILVMLINEAIDAVFMQVATKEDIEKAMTKGVNYPKGLLEWANEMSLDKVLEQLEALQQEYGEERYRPNPLLKRMVRNGQKF